jgi:hypothetical protein
MIPSRRNSIWGRNYDLGQNASGGWQFICSSGGKLTGLKKRVTLGLNELSYHPIEIDRAEFARLLKQKRNNERNKNEQR